MIFGQQMRGNCSPNSTSTTRVPPIPVFISTIPGMITDDFSDHLSVTPERMFTHLPEDGRCGVRRDDGQQFALVGHIERIESQNLARPLDGVADRDLSFVDDHTDPAARCDFVQGRRYAAPCRVTQAVNLRAGVQHASDKRVERGRIALDTTLEF